MPLDEEALKQFIAKLPNPDKEHEVFGLGDDETRYVAGVLDAYRILTGEQALGAKFLIGHTQEARNHAPEWYESFPPGSPRHCGNCGTSETEGDVPWHSNPA